MQSCYPPKKSVGTVHKQWLILDTPLWHALQLA